MKLENLFTSFLVRTPSDRDVFFKNYLQTRQESLSQTYANPTKKKQQVITQNKKIKKQEEKIKNLTPEQRLLLQELQDLNPEFLTGLV